MQELEKGRVGQQGDQRIRMTSIRRMAELAREEVFLQGKICQETTKIRVAWRKWIEIECSLCFSNASRE